MLLTSLVEKIRRWRLRRRNEQAFLHQHTRRSEEEHVLQDASQSSRDLNENQIVRAIYTFVSEFRSQGPAQDEQQVRILFWNRLTFWGLLAYTILTLFLLIVGHNANTLNSESSRAWLGPVSATISSPLIVGNSLKVSIGYSNFGKDPAKEHGGLIKIQSFPQIDWSGGAAFQRLTKFRNTCFATSPNQTIGLAFPSNSNSSYSISIDSSDRATFIGDKPLFISPDILSGNEIIAVSGCFVYETNGRIRHTSFCYHYDGTVANPDSLRYCIAGNDAD